MIAAASSPSGLSAVDHQWGGLASGRAYLLVGRAGSGRSALALQAARAAVDAGERCLIISPRAPESLVEIGRGVDLDLAAAHAAGLLRLLRIPSAADLAARGPEGLATSYRDLSGLVASDRPARVIIEDFTPLVQFDTFGRFRDAFSDLVGRLRDQGTTLLVGLGDPANDASRQLLEVVEEVVDGTIRLGAGGDLVLSTHGEIEYPSSDGSSREAVPPPAPEPTAPEPFAPEPTAFESFAPEPLAPEPPAQDAALPASAPVPSASAPVPSASAPVPTALSPIETAAPAELETSYFAATVPPPSAVPSPVAPTPAGPPSFGPGAQVGDTGHAAAAAAAAAAAFSAPASGLPAAHVRESAEAEITAPPPADPSLMHAGSDPFGDDPADALFQQGFLADSGILPHALPSAAASLAPVALPSFAPLGGAPAAAPDPNAGFHSALAASFATRVTGTPFQVVAMRMDVSAPEAAYFGTVEAGLRSVLRPGDELLVDGARARAAVVLPASTPAAGQALFAGLQAYLRAHLGVAADQALQSVAAVTISDGQPFQSAADLVAYAVDG